MTSYSDQYKKEFSIAIKYSNGFKDLRPFGLLMKDISSWEEYALFYCFKLQDELFDRNLIPFKIESIMDINKLEHCTSVVRDILVHVWLAISRVSEKKPDSSIKTWTT